MYNVLFLKILLRCNKIDSITIGFDISMCLHLILVDDPLLLWNAANITHSYVQLLKKALISLDYYLKIIKLLLVFWPDLFAIWDICIIAYVLGNKQHFYPNL